MFGLREPKPAHSGESGSDPGASSPCRVDRRTALRTLLLAGGALLVGCSGTESGGPPPDPVSLAGGKKCDVCGMVISEHPGPSGQIFYRHHTPNTHDEPFRFDSLKGGLFPFYFEHKQRGWTVSAVYVTDYSRVDYNVWTAQDTPYIESATAPDTFADATTVVFVVGSRVHGAMGAEFIPFSEKSDAKAFARKYGGRLVSWDQMTPKMLGR